MYYTKRVSVDGGRRGEEGSRQDEEEENEKSSSSQTNIVGSRPVTWLLSPTLRRCLRDLRLDSSKK